MTFWRQHGKYGGGGIVQKIPKKRHHFSLGFNIHGGAHFMFPQIFFSSLTCYSKGTTNKKKDKIEEKEEKQTMNEHTPLVSCSEHWYFLSILSDLRYFSAVFYLILILMPYIFWICSTFLILKYNSNILFVFQIFSHLKLVTSPPKIAIYKSF